MSHYNSEEVWSRLAYALKNNCNMLANTGPLPDGSIHKDDINVLRKIGKRIREHGWPALKDAINPNPMNALKKDDKVAMIG